MASALSFCDFDSASNRVSSILLVLISSVQSNPLAFSKYEIWTVVIRKGQSSYGCKHTFEGMNVPDENMVNNLLTYLLTYIPKKEAGPTFFRCVSKGL